MRKRNTEKTVKLLQIEELCEETRKLELRLDTPQYNGVSSMFFSSLLYLSFLSYHYITPEKAETEKAYRKLILGVLTFGLLWLFSYHELARRQKDQELEKIKQAIHLNYTQISKLLTCFFKESVKDNYTRLSNFNSCLINIETNHVHRKNNYEMLEKSLINLNETKVIRKIIKNILDLSVPQEKKLYLEKEKRKKAEKYYSLLPPPPPPIISVNTSSETNSICIPDTTFRSTDESHGEEKYRESTQDDSILMPTPYAKNKPDEHEEFPLPDMALDQGELIHKIIYTELAENISKSDKISYLSELDIDSILQKVKNLLEINNKNIIHIHSEKKIKKIEKDTNRLNDIYNYFFNAQTSQKKIISDNKKTTCLIPGLESDIASADGLTYDIKTALDALEKTVLCLMNPFKNLFYFFPREFLTTPIKFMQSLEKSALTAGVKPGRALLVGSVVRYIFRPHHPPRDFDMIVSWSGTELQKILKTLEKDKNYRCIFQKENTCLYEAMFDELKFQMACGKIALDKDGGILEHALECNKRDFNVNSILLSSQGEILDPLGVLNLSAKKQEQCFIRACDGHLSGIRIDTLINKNTLDAIKHTYQNIDHMELAYTLKNFIADPKRLFKHYTNIQQGVFHIDDHSPTLKTILFPPSDMINLFGLIIEAHVKFKKTHLTALFNNYIHCIVEKNSENPITHLSLMDEKKKIYSAPSSSYADRLPLEFHQKNLVFLIGSGAEAALSLKITEALSFLTCSYNPRKSKKSDFVATRVAAQLQNIIIDMQISPLYCQRPLGEKLFPFLLAIGLTARKKIKPSAVEKQAITAECGLPMTFIEDLQCILSKIPFFKSALIQLTQEAILTLTEELLKPVLTNVCQMLADSRIIEAFSTTALTQESYPERGFFSRNKGPVSKLLSPSEPPAFTPDGASYP